MIDGLFDVSVDTPKHHRRGTLSLRSSGAKIDAVLKVGDHEPLSLEGSCEEQDFSFSGAADLPGIGKGAYEAKGNVWGNSVTVDCTTPVGKIEIFGTRLSAAAGAIKSSHDYLMKASTGEFAPDDDTMYSGLYADGG